MGHVMAGRMQFLFAGHLKSFVNSRRGDDWTWLRCLLGGRDALASMNKNMEMGKMDFKVE